MLKDLGLDLDLTRSKRPFKVQLALPSKVITQNILNINTANISDVQLNSLPHFEFETPYLVESKNKGVTDNIEYIKNPDLDSIKEDKLYIFDNTAIANDDNEFEGLLKIITDAICRYDIKLICIDNLMTYVS